MLSSTFTSELIVTPTLGEPVFDEEPKAKKGARKKGARLAGVTTILKDVGLVDTTWYTDTGRERGSTVHEFCQLELEDDLIEKSVDPRLRGYLEALRKFVRETEYKSEACERRVKNEAYGYIGRTDSWGTWLKGKAVLDFKTGTVLPVTRYQLVAYAGCLQSPGSYWRLAVQLNLNGEYRLTPYPPADYLKDWSRWTSILDVYNLRKELKFVA